MKEVGYEVSKDYEKLRKMFAEAKERVAVFGYSDNYQNCIRDRVIIDNINDFDYGDNRVCMMSVDNHGSDDLYFLDLDELVSRCIELQVTFIDPNPPNPNAIYYADGQEVNIDDNFKFIRHNDKSIYFIFFGQGSLYATNGQYIKLLSDFISVGWKNDCMTNAEKVETREDK